MLHTSLHTNSSTVWKLPDPYSINSTVILTTAHKFVLIFSTSGGSITIKPKDFSQQSSNRNCGRNHTVVCNFSLGKTSSSLNLKTCPDIIRDIRTDTQPKHLIKRTCLSLIWDSEKGGSGVEWWGDSTNYRAIASLINLIWEVFYWHLLCKAEALNIL